MSSHRARPHKVALIQPVIPSYRLSFLRAVAARPEIDLTVFHSRGLAQGAQSVGSDLPFDARMVKALYAPRKPGPFYQAVLRQILTGGYDVVVCYQSINNFSSLALWGLRQVLGYRFVWWGIGFDPYRQKDPDTPPDSLAGKAMVAVKDLVWRKADANLTYSTSGKAYSVRKGVPAHRLFPLHNTVDVEAMWAEQTQIDDADLARVRQEWGVGADDFVFLFLGRLHPRKEVPFLVRSFARVALEHPHVKLLVLGDGQESSTVDSEIERLGLQGRVVRTGALYDVPTVSRLMLLADVVTLPAQVGLTVVHSFAHGKPVLTRACDSFSPELEYLDSGRNGLFLEDPSEEAYAEAMGRLVMDRTLRERLSAGARTSAQDLTVEKMAGRFVNGVLYAAGRNP